MPDKYRQCYKSLNEGSGKIVGNWHYSMAAELSELQLYAYDVQAMNEVTLVVSCINNTAVTRLQTESPLGKSGSMKVYSKNKHLWKGEWETNSDDKRILAQPMSLLNTIAESRSDTVRIEFSGGSTKPSVALFRVLGTEKALRQLTCSN